MSQFRFIELGNDHLCVYMDKLRCYGSNEHNQLETGEKFDYIALSSGGDHTCAVGLNPGVGLNCWGLNDAGQTAVVSEDNYLQLVTGEKHTCAMKSSYYLKCWGSSKYNVTTIPDKVKNFVQLITLGAQFTCDMRSGKIRCIGKHEKKLNKVPEGISTNVKNFMAGFNHICAERNQLQFGGN